MKDTETMRHTCWMTCTMLLLTSACTMTHHAVVQERSLRQATETLMTMMRVADWQIAHPSLHAPLDWTQGALYPGLLALDGIQGNTKYQQWIKKTGDKADWKNGGRLYHADDYAVSQSYSELYQLYRDPVMIAPTLQQFDTILKNPPEMPVGEIQSRNQPMRWWWCDALFMAPPAWAKIYDLTDDPKYLDFMIKEWKATSAFLYDQEEHLFYRDKNFFPSVKKESNGKKVFWGRGNGWVLGGLVRVLQVLPDNHPERPFFVGQFQQMCRKMLKIQPADGVWRASLLAPENFPIEEASASSFISYALAWGLNQGYLTEKEAEPGLRSAYQKLCTFITPEGKLTHVQPVGADPQKFSVESTDIYGVGAFLMASAELYRMDILRAKPHAELRVENKSDCFCPQKTIQLDWQDVLKRVPTATPDSIAVMDGSVARWLTIQVLTADGVKPIALLFQTDLHAGQTKKFHLVAGMNRSNLPQSIRSTTARFVPERKDDFAWENDRTAYRAYGPALWVSDGAKPGKPASTGNGIDVWGKNDRLPIINRMYKEKNYHSPDLGYGIDAYGVGAGPGCGGSAVISNGDYHAAITFEQWKVLASGPIRSVFELTYATGEIRTFSIDLGTDFFQVVSTFPHEVEPACGSTYRPVDAQSAVSGDGWVAVWEAGQNNVPINMGLALVVPDGTKPFIRNSTAWIHAPKAKTLTAYIGSCWSKGKDYATAPEWFSAVDRFRKQRIATIEIH